MYQHLHLLNYVHLHMYDGNWSCKWSICVHVLCIYIMVFRLRWRQAFKRARHLRSVILTRRSRGGRKITFAPYLIAPFPLLTSTWWCRWVDVQTLTLETLNSTSKYYVVNKWTIHNESKCIISREGLTVGSKYHKYLLHISRLALPSNYVLSVC